MTLLDLSSDLTPGGTGRGRAPPSTPALTGTSTPAPSAKTEGTAVSKQDRTKKDLQIKAKEAENSKSEKS
jgi:hypothetical protein